jgi:acetyl-CoA acetyltransferase
MNLEIATDQAQRSSTKWTDIGLIGYGSAPYERKPTRTEFAYLAAAARAALGSASVTKNEVDGLSISSTTLAPDNAVTAAEQLGLELGWAHTSTSGGAGGVAAVLAALEAVAAGRAHIVLCLAGAAQDMAFFRERITHFTRSIGDYIVPHGYGGLNGLFGIITRKHMETFGTQRRQLGRIAVDQRRNATNNELALLRAPLTMDEYLNAPLVAEPLRLYDCVMPCSGAEAVLVGPLDRVPKGHRIRVAAGAERHNHPPGEIAPLAGGWEVFRDDLYRNAAAGPPDMDVVQLYDDYPVMVAIQLEDLGFCAKGEAGPFLDAHSLCWDGDLPLNTGGGQLSCGQCGGGGGMIGVVESVRQLRGEASGRQVPAARRSLVSGYGMVSYGHGLSASALVMERS